MDSTRTDIETILRSKGLWDGAGESPLLDETAAFKVAEIAGFSEITLTRSAMYEQPWMAIVEVPNVDTCVTASSPALAIVLAVLKAMNSQARWIDVLVAGFTATEHTSLMAIAEEVVREIAAGRRPVDSLLEEITHVDPVS